MPYILGEKRLVENSLKETVRNYIDCSGDLNFAITVLMAEYVLKKGLGYQNIHDAVNTAFDASCEFKRRIEYPYEDIAIKKNGDVLAIQKLVNQIEEKDNG